MARKNYDRKRKGTRSQKGAGKHVLIYCQGTSTEVTYFKKLQNEYRIPGISIRSEAKEPEQLVGIAKRVATAEGYEQVFVVVDVDNSKSEKLQKAISECKKSRGCKVSLIVSNPAFEVWLYMHTSRVAPPSKPLADITKELLKRNHLNSQNVKEINFDVFPYRQWETALQNNHAPVQENQLVEEGTSAVGIVLKEILKDIL